METKMEKRYDKGYTREQIAEVKQRIKTMVAQQKGEGEWGKAQEYIEKGNQLREAERAYSQRLLELGKKRNREVVFKAPMPVEEKQEYAELSKLRSKPVYDYLDWLKEDRLKYPKPDAWTMTRMLNIYHFIRGSDYRHAPLQIESGRQPIINEAIVEKVLGFKPE